MDAPEDARFRSNPDARTPTYEVLPNSEQLAGTAARLPYLNVNGFDGNWSVLEDSDLSLENETDKVAARGKTSYYKAEQVGFLTFLFVGIVIANITVLLATTLSKHGFKSRMTFFIMHLAIADLMVGLVSVLTDLLWKVTAYWYAGNVMCHVVRYLQAVAMFGSTYVLVALSIDRLEAIARPMSFHNSRTRARILIITAWILSGLMALPLLILFKETGDLEHKQCVMRLPNLFYWKLYVTLLAACLFFIPTFIISLCYCVIIYVIWSKARSVTSPRQANRNKRFVKRFSSKDSAKLRQIDDKDSTECIQSSKGVIPHAKIRTIKLTLVIVIVFIICWSPYFIFNLLDVYGLIPSSPNKRAISILIGSFAPLNSLANPIIYGIFTTMIYKNLRRIPFFNFLARRLCCCCCCCCGGGGGGGGGGDGGDGVRSTRRPDTLGSLYASTRQTYVISSSASDSSSRRQRDVTTADGNYVSSNNDVMAMHTLVNEIRTPEKATRL